MAHIHIDNRIMKKVQSEDLVALIQSLIHTELQKPEKDINSDFVEECVNALLEIEQDEDRAFVPLVPLVKRQEFIAGITGNKHNFKSLNRFARVAIVAATLAASTVTANAAVEAVTGVNVLAEAGSIVQDKLQDWGLIKTTGIDIVDGEDDDDETTVPTTEKGDKVSTTTTTTKIAETTTSPSSVTSTSHHIENIEGEDDDETTTTTKKAETTTEQNKTTTKPATTNKHIPPTTEPAITDKYVPEDEIILVGLKAEYSSDFKSDYIYGEALSYEGMTLTAIFSDGSEKEVSLKDCSYTKSLNMNTTADYTLSVTYKSATVKVNITVRPDEDTRGSKICSNDDYEYLLTDKGVYVTKYKGSNTEITADTIDNEIVIAFGDSAFAGSNIQKVTAENLVKFFDNAFKDCEKLISVWAPNAEYIGNSVFENCISLEQAVNSNKLAYIGENSYKNTAVSEIIIPSGITEIPNSLFEDCENLVRVEFEGRVISIGDYAFCECPNLEKVTGTNYIKSVGKYAFYNDGVIDFDTALPLLEIADDYAFAYCDCIQFGDLPKGIQEIGQWAFAYCKGLTSADIPSGITEIPYGAFRGTSISTLILHEGLKVIDKYAFMSTKITTVKLPDSLEEIGIYGLYSVNLTTVYFGKNVRLIGANAFSKTSRLTFYVYRDTYPLEYAIDNNIKYELLDE